MIFSKAVFIDFDSMLLKCIFLFCASFIYLIPKVPNFLSNALTTFRTDREKCEIIIHINVKTAYAFKQLHLVETWFYSPIKNILYKFY